MSRHTKTFTADADPLGYDEVAHLLDLMASAIKNTRNRNLLPIYERLERELDALKSDEAAMGRALKRSDKRAKKRKTKKPAGRPTSRK